MRRMMYRAQVKEGCVDSFLNALFDADWKQSLLSQDVISCSVYKYRRQLFVYLETREAEYRMEWPEASTMYLELWTGDEQKRYAVPMLDIFHDGEPEAVDTWRAGREVKERVGSLARLKPEMFSSYVFYHYQKQEETPQSFNKTYMIGTHEQYIFSYQELPAAVDGKGFIGKLTTKLSPGNWHEVMFPHFELWKDDNKQPEIWKPLESVFSFVTRRR